MTDVTRPDSDAPEFNPFASPDTDEPLVRFGEGDYELASRAQRLGGAMLDGILYLPGLLFFAVGDDMGTLLLLGCYILAVALVQWTLITRSGQSLGKRIVGTRIVRVEDGALPGFIHGVVLRMWVPTIIGMIPYAGSVFSLANILYIFGEPRRCLHDYIARTRVIEATERVPSYRRQRPKPEDLPF